MPDQMPSATPRRSAGKAAESSVRLSGSTSAAPAPWKARAATSSPEPGASAAAAEASVNSRESELEDPAPPEAVAERGARQQQHGERQRVRVDEPAELLDRRTEVAADARQRGRHDEVVEHDHEQRGARDGERDARVALPGPGGGAGELQWFCNGHLEASFMNASTDYTWESSNHLIPCQCIGRAHHREPCRGATSAHAGRRAPAPPGRGRARRVRAARVRGNDDRRHRAPRRHLPAVRRAALRHQEGALPDRDRALLRARQRGLSARPLPMRPGRAASRRWARRTSGS